MRADSTGACHQHYARVKTVEAMLLDSLPLLPRGQLSTAAMQQFNEIQARDRVLVPRIGQAPEPFLSATTELKPWLTSPFTQSPINARVLPDAPTVARLISYGDVFEDLWSVIAGAVLNRLKRCPQCQRWFVDVSRNCKATRCSMACTNKWWTRERRMAAGHGKKKRKTR
jgi:hypothetical protein